MSEYKFPTFIDASMLNTFRQCELKWAWQSLHHLAPATANINLLAGGAIARGMEVARKAFYVDKLPQQQAVGKGFVALILAYGDFNSDKEKKTWDATAGAYIYYTDHFPFATDPVQPYLVDSKATVEYSFSLPLPIANPDTAEPLLYVGRFDMLGNFNGQTFCVDEKTTGSLGPKWSEKWQLRGQFIGYCYAAREHGYNVAGALVRGIAIYVGGYAVQEAIVYTPDWKIEEWKESTYATIERMIAVYKSGKYRKAFNDACTAYNRPCEFTLLCDSPHPERWISPYYKEHIWNPLEKEEI